MDWASSFKTRQSLRRNCCRSIINTTTWQASSDSWTCTAFIRSHQSTTEAWSLTKMKWNSHIRTFKKDILTYSSTSNAKLRQPNRSKRRQQQRQKLSQESLMKLRIWGDVKSHSIHASVQWSKKMKRFGVKLRSWDKSTWNNSRLSTN